MNKKTLRIAGWALGLSMAVAGIGTVVGTSLAVNDHKAVVANAATDTYSFSSIPTTGWTTNGGSQTINGKSWTYSSSVYIGNSSSRIQVGSKNNPQTTGWTIQTPVSSFLQSGKRITSVAITAYTTATTATYSIFAGNAVVNSGNLTTSSATYTASSLNITSGNIIVTLCGSSTSKAMYLTDISVTYEDVPAATYTVTYAPGDGASGSMSPDEGVYGTYELKPNGFDEPDGKIFKEWKIGNSAYNPGDEITVESDVTVTAQWSAPRTVSFNNNGGTGSIESVTVADGKKYTLPGGTGFVAPDGYAFGGWKVNNEGETKAAGDEIDITADVTLYAVWAEAAQGTHESNPFTVEDAIAKIDASSTMDNAYVSGVICEVESYNSTYHSITYWISDDGNGESAKIKVYSGKGIGGAVFSAKGDLTVGQHVLIKGNLLKYQGSVYELDKNNEIVRFIPGTKTAIALKDGKGTYYNGAIQATNKLSTEDFAVTSLYDDDMVESSYNAGTGFTLKIYKNGTLFQTLDATSAVVTYQFNGADASSPSNVYTVKATVGELIESDAVEITIVQKAIASHEWTTAQKTEFYAHRDQFEFGVLKYTFNDTSSTSSSTYVKYALYEYDEEADNHIGSPASIPTHSDGTINLSEPAKYVVDTYHKDYASTSHVYTVVDVKIPTLTITDNYAGNYYVGVSRDLDVTVTAHFGEESRVLEASEYELSADSVEPANTDDINVTASWIIDGSPVLTSSALTIQPIESNRVLNELVIDAQSFTAGSYFSLSEDAILLDATEGENKVEELDQGLVSFTHKSSGKALTSGTRLTKSEAGTIVANYAEGSGDGKEVSCEFNLTITDAIVESYTAPSVAENATVATSISVGDRVYLVSESDKVQLNGISSTSTKYGLGENYESNINSSLYVLEVVAGSADGTVAFQTPNGSYLYWTSGNSLNTSATLSDKSSWNVSFDGNNAVITNADTASRRIRWNSDRFACYTSDVSDSVQIYKKAATPSSGNEVSYLKSVIDAYRLNNGTENLSICASSGLYGTSEWVKAKAAFQNLTSSQRTQLSVQDYFGEEGKTYVDTFEMLIAKDPGNAQNSSFMAGQNDFGGEPTYVIATLVGSGLVAGAGLFLIRRRKEN